MSRLWKREVQITPAKPDGFFTQRKDNAILITKLRVQFNIKKNLRAEPNKCDITINNLSEETIQEFSKNPVHVRVDVGYDGKLKRIFTGDLRWSETVPDGVNRSTKLQCADGDRAFKHARVNKSFNAGLSTKDALKHISESMGLKIPTNASQAKDLLKQFASGSVLNGPSEAQLTKLLNPSKRSWSVQDGQLHILKDSEVRPGEAFVISEDTGMVGFPSFGPPAEKKKKPILKVKSLMFPEISPGIKIKVISKRVNGVFRVETATHDGDTHGTNWYTDIEATPL